MKRYFIAISALVLGFGLLTAAFAADRCVLCEMVYGEG